MLPYPHDPEKHFLGKICPRGHEYYGTGQGLRYHCGSKQCVQCILERKHKAQNQKYKERGFPHCQWPRQRFNPEIQFLGKLCPRGHDYGTGQSVRNYADNNGCVICRAMGVKKRRKENPRLFAEAHKRYRHKNPEYFREFDRRRWPQVYAKNKVYYAQKANKRRHLARQNHNAPYTQAQIDRRFAELGAECAYCGSKELLQADHFIPLSMGGPDVLGNIVPACRHCNYSKHNYEAESWYRKQPFFSQKRWSRIVQLMGLQKVSEGQLPLF